MQQPEKRLVIVSNRLPIVLEKQQDSWQVSHGAGGLVTALAPVLRNRGGLWIGWPGAPDDGTLTEPITQASNETGYRLVPVMLTDHEIHKYYHGFSNEIIWPLFQLWIGSYAAISTRLVGVISGDQPKVCRGHTRNQQSGRLYMGP